MTGRVTPAAIGDPWRLVCPECGTTDWRARRSGRRYCPHCQKRIDGLRDKKTGEVVR